MRFSPSFRNSLLRMRAWSFVLLQIGLLILPGNLLANPLGGSVVAGSASINQAGNTTTINQATNNAIINWQGFSIAPDELTQFNLPNSSAAVLNRVTGGNPSAILGSLQSNGRVFLINPNGILVGQGAQINVGGLVASTLDINNADFMNGNYHFQSNSDASVINFGQIRALSGDIYLLGAHVENHGLLQASHGTVGLAAGQDVRLVDSGHQHLVVRPNANSLGGTGVLNTGTINAVQAELAANGGNVYALAINNTGTVRANGAVMKNGEVYLTSKGGDISSSGNIIAKNKDGSGGEIQVLGDEVRLAGGTIDVSGANGGGVVLVGGDYQGANPTIANARTVYVDSAAMINADATLMGDGGKVIVWSDDTTNFAGNISARGGINGGDGGFAEVSGKQTLQYTGLADLRAPLGQVGTLLLDPNDAEINTVLTVVGASLITPGTITTQLGLSHVVVQTSGTDGEPGDVFVNAPVIYSSANDFSILAHRNIEANASIQNGFGTMAGDGGAVNLVAGWDGSTGFTATPDMQLEVGSANMAAIFADNNSFGNGNGSVFIGNDSTTTGVAVGSRFGATNVAAYDLTLRGSDTNSDAFAQLGFRADTSMANFDIDGSIDVVLQNNLTANGGDEWSSYVQVGHGGQDADGNLGSNINVTAAGVAFEGGDDRESYAQLGHGGYRAVGDIQGNITILASTGDVVFEGGTDEESYAQLGHGGYQSEDVALGFRGDIMVTVQAGNLFLAGGSEDETYAQLGHGGFEFRGAGPTSSLDGNLTISVAQGDLDIVGGDGFNAYALLGHGGSGAETDENITGTIGVTVGGNLNLLAGISSSGAGSYVQLGHGGDSSQAHGAIGFDGNITVDVTGDLNLFGGSDSSNYVHLGLGGNGGGDRYTGDIDVTVGGNLNMVGGSDNDTYVHIGHADPGSTGDVVMGNIELRVAGESSLVNGTASRTPWLIGHGDLTNLSNADVTFFSGTLDFDNTVGNTAFAASGVGLNGTSADDFGAVMAANLTGGHVTLVATNTTAGPTGGMEIGGVFAADSPNNLSFVSLNDIRFGDGASVLNDSSGEINVVAGWDGSTGIASPLNIVDIFADASSFANNNGSVFIGDGTQANGIAIGSRFGPTNVATSGLVVNGGNTLAQIGFFDTFTSPTAIVGIDGPIVVVAQGGVQLLADTDGIARVGHAVFGDINTGGDIDVSVGIKGNVNVTGAGFSLDANGDNSVAQIGHAADINVVANLIGNAGAAGTDSVGASANGDDAMGATPVTDGGVADAGLTGGNGGPGGDGKLVVRINTAIEGDIIVNSTGTLGDLSLLAGGSNSAAQIGHIYRSDILATATGGTGGRGGNSIGGDANGGHAFLGIFGVDGGNGGIGGDGGTGGNGAQGGDGFISLLKVANLSGNVEVTTNGTNDLTIDAIGDNSLAGIGHLSSNTILAESFGGTGGAGGNSSGGSANTFPPAIFGPAAGAGGIQTNTDGGTADTGGNGGNGGFGGNGGTGGRGGIGGEAIAFAAIGVNITGDVTVRALGNGQGIALSSQANNSQTRIGHASFVELNVNSHGGAGGAGGNSIGGGAFGGNGGFGGPVVNAMNATTGDGGNGGNGGIGGDGGTGGQGGDGGDSMFAGFNINPTLDGNVRVESNDGVTLDAIGSLTASQIGHTARNMNGIDRSGGDAGLGGMSSGGGAGGGNGGGAGGIIESPSGSGASAGSVAGNPGAAGIAGTLGSDGTAGADGSRGFIFLGARGGSVGVNLFGDINVTAEGQLAATSTGGYTQLGHGGNAVLSNDGGEFMGNITVDVGGNLNLIGGTEEFSYSQIGHGGPDLLSGLMLEDIRGNIMVTTAGNATALGGSAEAAYVQLGHGGESFVIDEEVEGDISLIATGNVIFTAGNGRDTYALLGHGGDNADVGDDLQGNISVSGNNILFTAGAGREALAQLGHGGSDTEVGDDLQGNIMVTATGNITFLGGGSEESYAQLGHGGSNTIVDDDVRGSIMVTATGDITFRGGSENITYAQLGHGGDHLFVDDEFRDTNITVNAMGNLNFTAGDGKDAYAQLGHGGNHAVGNADGKINVTAADINFSGGTTGDNTYAQLGHGGNEADGNFTGDIMVKGANFNFLGGSVNDSYAQLGHGGDGASGDFTGDITVMGANFNFLGGTGDDAFVQLGHGGNHAVGNADGKINVTAADINFSGGTTDDNTYAQLGHGGNEADGDFTGDITVKGANFNFLGGSVNDSYAQLGHGGDGADGNHNGAITVNATGNLNFEAGTGSDAYAQLGHGGENADGNHNGAITVDATGNLNFEAGTGNDAYAQLGHGGNRFDGALNGAINVTANNLNFSGGSNRSDTYAQLGHGGTDADGNFDGDITIVAANLNFLAGTATDSYAMLGHGGDNTDGDLTGDINVIALDLLFMAGSGSESFAQLGHGGSDLRDSPGLSTTSGAIRIDVSNITFIGGSGSAAFAQLGHGGENARANLSGDITVNLTGDLTLTAGSRNRAYSQLGHGAASGPNIGMRTGDIRVISGGSVFLTGDGANRSALLGHDTNSAAGITGDITLAIDQTDPLADNGGRLFMNEFSLIDMGGAPNQVRIFGTRRLGNMLADGSIINGIVTDSTLPLGTLAGGRWNPNFEFLDWPHELWGNNPFIVDQFTLANPSAYTAPFTFNYLNIFTVFPGLRQAYFDVMNSHDRFERYQLGAESLGEMWPNGPYSVNYGEKSRPVGEMTGSSSGNYFLDEFESFRTLDTDTTSKELPASRPLGDMTSDVLAGK